MHLNIIEQVVGASGEIPFPVGSAAGKYLVGRARALKVIPEENVVSTGLCGRIYGVGLASWAHEKPNANIKSTMKTVPKGNDFNVGPCREQGVQEDADVLADFGRNVVHFVAIGEHRLGVVAPCSRHGFLVLIRFL